jgi:hypothetical protein
LSSTSKVVDGITFLTFLHFAIRVQEGMVFISMGSDDLLARTAQYQIQYSPPSTVRGDRSSHRRFPSSNATNYRTSSRILAPFVELQERRRALASPQDDDTDVADPSDYCDTPQDLSQILPDFPAPTPPPFTVTTECSDDEGSGTVRSSRTRIGAFAFELDEDEEQDDGGSDIAELNGLTSQRRGRETPSRIAALGHPGTDQYGISCGTTEHGKLMAPHARFFIERNKSKCTVRFDPPV